MTPQYPLKIIFVLASGLALQAHAANTPDAKNSLENMSVVTSFDPFNMADEYSPGNPSTRRPTSSNLDNRPNTGDLKKVSPDTIWEVDDNPFNETDPW
jgi:hypothetical protein